MNKNKAKKKKLRKRAFELDVDLDVIYERLSMDSRMVDFPGGSDGKSICLQCGRPGFNTWVGKIPWRRKWQPTPVFLPGKSHGQRSLAGCSPWGRKELDTTERLHFQDCGPVSAVGMSRDMVKITGKKT